MADLTKTFEVKNGITFDNAVSIITGAGNPAVLGTPAPVGTMLLSDNGDAYAKTGSGDTDWGFIETSRSINKSASTTLLTSESGYIHVDATAGSVIITLPPVALATNKIFHIMKVDASQNSVTIVGSGGELIENAASIVIKQKGVWFAVRSDGVDWTIVSQHPSPDPQTIQVAKSGASFSSIADAINTITTAGPTNYYIVTVGPGTYIEPEITIPPYVSIVGEAIPSTIVQPAGNHHVFTMSGHCELSSLTIKGAPSGYAGIYVNDAPPPTIINEVWFEDCDTAIRARNTTTQSLLRLRNLRVSGNYTVGYDVDSPGNAILQLSISATSLSPSGLLSPTAIRLAGSTSQLVMDSARISGVPSGTGTLITNGAIARITDTHYTGWGSAVKSDSVGTNAELTMSSVVFIDNTMNIEIDNATTTGFFAGGYSEYTKYNIHSSSPFFIVNKDSQAITVAKTGGDFTSVKAAVDSITDASSSNRYVIVVGPGNFIESTITMKPYVSVIGTSANSTVLISAVPTQHLIVGADDTSLEFVTLTGSTNSGYAAVYHNSNNTDPTVQFRLGDVTFGNNHTQCMVISNGTNITNVALERCGFGDGYNFTRGIVVESQPGGQANVLINTSTLLPTDPPAPEVFLSVKGSGATGTLMASQITSSISFPTGDAVVVADGGSVRLTGNCIEGFARGMWAENDGAAPRVGCVGSALRFNTRDIVIDHPAAYGCVSAVAAVNKVEVDYNSNVSLFYVDSEFNNIVMVGDVYLGQHHENIAPVTNMILAGSSMGLYSGGHLEAVTGLTLSVASGTGYVRDLTDINVKYLTWIGQQIVLPDDSDLYVYVNNLGVVSTAASLPNTLQNVILGHVATSDGDIVFVDKIPYLAEHSTDKLAQFNREALGAIYVSGSVVSENVITPRSVDVTGGLYYFSQNRFTPSGGTAISFVAYYHSLGAWVRAAQTVASNTHYDDGTNLATLTAGYYAKHALYIVGEGVNEKYLLVYSQNEWATIEAARLGDLPSPPPSFRLGVTPIAGIIVQEGNANIVEISSERSFPSYKAGGTTSVTNHGDLLGLSGDDHTQYLLVDGSRPMVGGLDMGANNITNVGTVDGVDVSAHASRHLPNGLDPLSTAAPTTDLTTSTLNAEGTANSFARSDHTHSISGVQTASAELTGVSSLASTGIVSRTATGTYATRTITAPASGITLTNGDGVAGNPTLGLSDDLAAIEALTTQGFTSRTGLNTWATRTIVGSGAGISVSNGDGVSGDPTLSLSNDLAAVEGLSGDGFAVRTTTDTWANRSLVPPPAGFTINNPAGIAGNPTFALSNDLAAVEAISTNGLAVRTSLDTWSTRSIAGTANQIDVQDGTGVSGNPTISFVPNPVIPGTASIHLPSGTTAQRPTVPSVGMVRINTTDQLLEGYTNPYGVLTTPNTAMMSRTLANRRRRVIVDDFMAGGLTPNTVHHHGELGWTSSSVGAGAAFAEIASVTDHPGILSAITGGAAGRSVSIHLGSTPTSTSITANQVAEMSWVIRIPDITSTQLTAGMGLTLSTPAFGTNAVRFHFNPATSANWQFITTAAGVSSTVVTNVTVTSNTWYLLEMFYDGTAWNAVINGVTQTPIASNIPVVAVGVGLLVQSDTAATRAAHIDHFSLITRELGNRY